MKLYNTLTRSVDEFAPADGRTVKMYVCGPTVYNYFHIGNARCFVVFDMLRRYLEYRGYEVRMVQNFTDVDDKMIKRANEEGTTVADIAARYIAEYETDARGLGIRPATVHPRATENIGEIIEIVKALVDKGDAYESNGDVYFRTKSFPQYGKLSHMPIDDLEAGARIDVSEQKEDPLDFALWKAAKPGEPKWPSPWGEGRPGWHIECSAMARRYLGETIDIHCGGQDLVFPHHENEIAQSECANGCEFARFWVHNGYININNEKMSKSKGNFFTVRDIAAHYGYAPIRFFLLSAQYRSPVNFTEEVIKASAASLQRINGCLADADFLLSKLPDEPLREGEDLSVFDSKKDAFVAAMDNDFNTADGVAAVFELVRELNRAMNPEGGAARPSRAFIAHGAALLRELAELFGFVTDEKAGATDEGGMTDERIEELIALRAAAKKEKNFARADEIRAQLLEAGIVLEDTREGTKYKRNA
jgi:cysteinyl-tRNA synthetase